MCWLILRHDGLWPGHVDELHLVRRVLRHLQHDGSLLRHDGVSLVDLLHLNGSIWPWHLRFLQCDIVFF